MSAGDTIPRELCGSVNIVLLSKCFDLVLKVVCSKRLDTDTVTRCFVNGVGLY